MATIWHNPRCSKSRKTLSLLREKGIEPEVVEYLNSPPTASELRDVLDKLGLEAGDLVRKGEKVFKELELKDAPADMLIAAMAANPILIERPIVFHNGKAAMGRPPENVLEIF